MLIIKLWILRHTTSKKNNSNIIISENFLPNHYYATAQMLSCNCYHYFFHQNCFHFQSEAIVYIKKVLSLHISSPWEKVSQKKSTWFIFIYFSNFTSLIWYQIHILPYQPHSYISGLLLGFFCVVFPISVFNKNFISFFK